MGIAGDSRGREGYKDHVKAKPKAYIPFTDDELWEMSRREAQTTLNERMIRWCEIFVKSFNSELAAIKAGYAKQGAATVSRRLRKREDVRIYLAWLKLRAIDTLDVQPIDILEQYAKIGFSDITDFVTVKNGRMSMVDTDQIDGQVVKSYKIGKQGEMSVELFDKLAALRHLETFFSEMPKNWQQRIEERRLEIQEEKLAMEKEALGQLNDDNSETGSALINALKGVSTNVWNEEEGDDPEFDDED